MTEDIKVTFIIPKDCKNENECSEEMQVAFTACEQHCGGGLQAKWVHETNYKQFAGLTKRDVLVLSEFEGDLFERLRATKCLLVGPRCLSCSLMEGKPIPSGPEPVYTVAMRGLAVTASGLSKHQKEKIKRKVFSMGGIYSPALTDETTHLVSDTVLSDKYIKSIERGIPVMCESWIDAVWDLALQLNVNGASSDFDVHKLPVFANLQVTTSGISKKDKQIVMKLVNENGGTFSGAFQSETTDVVVLTKDAIGGEKYKAALEYHKACVLPSWVKDSVARGAALPLTKYKVAGASTSSPLAEHRLPDMSLNFSRITNARPPNNFVDETRSNDLSTISAKMKLSQEPKKSNDFTVDKEIVTAFENFNVSDIKKAGPIFDGFCIWVTGLEGICRERAAACVSRGGGVRYDCPHERVTHVVCGTRHAALAAAQSLPAVPVINPIWLIRSVAEKRALDESEFLIDTKPATPAKKCAPAAEAASPMSRRNLQLLRRGALPPPAPAAPVAPLAPQATADDLVNHYLSQPMPEPECERTPEPAAPAPAELTEDLTRLNELTEEIEQIFRGIKMEVQGLDSEAICEIGAEIAAAGGVVCACGAGGTHVLLPLEFDVGEVVTSHAEPVTVFWVKDCLSQQELLPIQYYHRPVKLPPRTDLLNGVVASLSTYSGVERAFLDELAKLLGATTQLRFCRRNTTNALASTHLICPTPSGDKYMGALKWGLPAVKAEWLLECARAGTRVSENEFLVGDTKVPPIQESEENRIQMEQPHQDEQLKQPKQLELQSKQLETQPKQLDLQSVQLEIQPKQSEVQTELESVMKPPVEPLRRGSVPSKENTPKTKLDAESEMSPASRYIAMARQGLLGETQDTPKRIQHLKDDAKEGSELRTPPLDVALSTPNLCGFSPTTRRRIQAVRRGEMPSDPIKTPIDPFEKNIPTPDSAFGAALRPGSGPLSPEARKRLWEVVHELPSKINHTDKEKHTPLSEIRNRFLAQFNETAAATPPSEHNLAPRKLHLQDQNDSPRPPAKVAKLSENQCVGRAATESQDITNCNKSALSSASGLPRAVDAQLQRLSAALSGLTAQRARRSTRDSISHPSAVAPESEPGPESQPNTVGWDDTTPASVLTEPSPPLIKRFMLSSNVDNREEIIEMIIHLGGEVCEGTELDLEATHLLCAAPGRSEKMLGSVACGRWVLHPAYVARSRQQGRFLDEEEYEWGNPRASCLPPLSGAERSLAAGAHRWRAQRARGRPGPFRGVRALLHVPAARRRLLARLVTAGGGAAPDMIPPYNNEDITVCFADIKRYPLSDRDAAWLISRKIPVCAPVLLSSYLTEETPPNPEDHCLPGFKP